jgi:hypothetical protein
MEIFGWIRITHHKKKGDSLTPGVVVLKLFVAFIALSCGTVSIVLKFTISGIPLSWTYVFRIL